VLANDEDAAEQAGRDMEAALTWSEERSNARHWSNAVGERLSRQSR
jgi:hypothetical protein